MRMPDDVDEGVNLILYACVGLDFIVDAPYEVA